MLQAIYEKLKSLAGIAAYSVGTVAFAAGKLLSPPANAIQRELSKDDAKRVLTRAAIGFATGTGLTWDRIQAAFLHDSEVISTLLVPLGIAIATSIPEALALYAHGNAKAPEDPKDKPDARDSENVVDKGLPSI